MTRLRLLFSFLLLALTVPFATADTILLNVTNVPGYYNASVGSVTLKQGVGGVQVTLQANSGFSFKVTGGDILFNTGASLTAANIKNLTIDGHSAGGFAFTGHGPKPFGSFNYDLRNLVLSPGYTSASKISFFISGITLAQLQPYGFAVHFCVGGGTSCGSGLTGFATHGGSTVPEPGTLSMLGTGLAGLAGVIRRRFRS